jgi:hypothetical protein
MFGGFIEQNHAALEFSGKVTDEFFFGGNGALDIPLQNAGHDKNRVAIGKEIATFKKELAAARKNRSAERPGNIPADPFIARAGRPDFSRRFTLLAPKSGGTCG